ncbi:MAG: SRPBCC domain-containing protein [Granulosicoccus sp.]|nr:SRPBCC domain-containing protein [Granulosicoccus sp.]
MNNQNYHRSIIVNTSANHVYEALTTGYSHWWTPCDNAFHETGDRIRFGFPPNVSYWTFEATKLIPNKWVELECVDAFHDIIEKPNASKTEWLGSRTIWKIKESEKLTQVDFEHVGLVPELACYRVCEAGWDHFFMNSLQQYLNTGTGTPHRMISFKQTN